MPDDLVRLGPANDSHNDKSLEIIYRTPAESNMRGGGSTLRNLSYVNTVCTTDLLNMVAF